MVQQNTHDNMLFALQGILVPVHAQVCMSPGSTQNLYFGIKLLQVLVITGHKHVYLKILIDYIPHGKWYLLL